MVPIMDTYVQNRLLFLKPVYLDQSGEPWKHPGWNTTIAILDGKRVKNTNVIYYLPDPNDKFGTRFLRRLHSSQPVHVTYYLS